MKKIVKILPLVFAPLLFLGCEKQEGQTKAPLISIGENGVQINSANGQNIVNLSDDGVQLNSVSGESLVNLNNNGVNIGNGVVTLGDDGVQLNSVSGESLVNLNNNGVNIGNGAVTLGDNGVNISNILKINNSEIVLNNADKITKILNGSIDTSNITIQDIQDLQKLRTAGYLENINLSDIHLQNNVNAEGGNIDTSNDTEIEQSESVSCEVKYKDLENMNYFDFSVCTTTDVRNSDLNITESEIPTKSMVLIFDSSGSMAAQINGKSRMEIAKKSVSKFLKTLDKNEKFKLSIVLYGHKGSNASSSQNVSCNGIDEIVPMNIVNSNDIEGVIAPLKPTGWTPISSSLKKAQNILATDTSDQKYILLVSDGKETCGGNPIETVKSIKQENSDIIVNVIGFDVDTETGSQLKGIAQAGDGKYFDVATEQQFAEALNENKKQLQKVDYAIGRSVEQIYDMSYITNTYMQCTTALERENAVMQIDINGSKLIGEECIDYANKRYNSRYEELQEIIEENYKNNKKTFQQNSSLIFEK